ncbi:MAG: hypothetical protein H6807_12125 [Planctomycetes bacterium]|nr:hypothetical protein [Planctomycetota bacterium]
MPWHDPQLWPDALTFDHDLAQFLRHLVDHSVDRETAERYFLDEAWLYRRITTDETELAWALKKAGFEEAHIDLDPFALAAQLLLGEVNLPELETAHGAVADWFTTRHEEVEKLRETIAWHEVPEDIAAQAIRRAAFAIETALAEGWLEEVGRGRFAITELGLTDLPFIDYAR